MRIGFDVGKSLSRDGIGTYTRELVRALARLEADADFDLVSLAEPPSERALGEHLGELPRRFSRRPFDPARLDLFHATSWSVPPDLRGRLVFTCYDLTFFTHPDCHTLDNKVHCTTGLLRARLTDATFIAISAATADDLSLHFGVPRQEIRVIHLAPAAGLGPLADAEARHRLAERFGLLRPPILAVGTLEPRKNLARLLEAYAGLPPDLRQLHPLAVAGGGGWKNEALARQVERTDGAHLLGQVDDADLVALYSTAAVFAYPSLAEGFGLPVVEAMACGAPVLTSKTDALREVTAGAARLVDPLDTDDIRRGLAELLADPAARRRLADRGRTRAAEFSWDEAARRTFELYGEVMEGGPGAHGAE